MSTENAEQQVEEGMRLARECCSKLATPANWHVLRAHLERMTRTIPGDDLLSDARFEGWFLAWRKSTWWALPSDPRKEMPAHWATSPRWHMERAWHAALMPLRAEQPGERYVP